MIADELQLKIDVLISEGKTYDEIMTFISNELIDELILEELKEDKCNQHQNK